MTLYLSAPAACTICGLSTSDTQILFNHSCDTQQRGGTCEDYPCCGHERGDCNGQLYGSDEYIKEQVRLAWATGHGDCDHEDGYCNAYDYEDGEDEDDLED